MSITMSSNLAVYDATPLESKPGEIRILEVRPGKNTSELCGTLVHHSLQDTPQSYEALSYMWGPSQNGEKITLGVNCDLPITDNLAHALRTLRGDSETWRIWIDAICINQTNVQERNQQVRQMRAVYQSAKTVIVWIDAEIDPACEAFKKFETLTDQSVIADLGRDFEVWEKLQPLFENPYWKRVWIQQEISFAKSLNIQCRGVRISSFNFYHYSRLLSNRREELDIHSSAWLNWATLHSPIDLPFRFRYLDPESHPIEGSTFSSQDLDLISILSRSYRLNCTDSRDRLYAMLFLACDFSEGEITIDYGLPVPEVFAKVAHFLVEKHDSLVFLSYGGMDPKEPSKLEKCPTWVPDWTRAPSKMIVSSHSSFLYRSLPIMRTLRPTFHANIAALTIHGVRLTALSEVIPIPNGADFYKSTVAAFLDICKIIIHKAMVLQGNFNASSVQNVLSTPQWHVLVGAITELDHYMANDNQKHDKLADLFFGSADGLVNACYHSDDGDTFKALTMAHLMNSKLPPHSDSGQTLARMCYDKLIKHMPFVGAKGEIGMAPKISNTGDEAWLVFGCDHVLILRSFGDYYKVVGEGYLEGYVRRELDTYLTRDLKVGDLVAGHVVEAIELR